MRRLHLLAAVTAALAALAVVEHFLGHERLAGMQAFMPGLAALIHLLCRRAVRHAELGRGGIVDHQHAALRVLDRDAGRQQPQHVAQKAQFGGGAGIIDFHCNGLKIINSMAFHGPRILLRSLFILVKPPEKYGARVAAFVARGRMPQVVINGMSTSAATRADAARSGFH